LKILNTIYEKIKNEPPTTQARILFVALTGEFILREASNVINAYSLIFIARAAQEQGSEVAEKLVKFAEELFTTHEATDTNSLALITSPSQENELELVENPIENGVCSPDEYITTLSGDEL
jgi:hypothetical protein